MTYSVCEYVLTRVLMLSPPPQGGDKYYSFKQSYTDPRSHDKPLFITLNVEYCAQGEEMNSQK